MKIIKKIFTVLTFSLIFLFSFNNTAQASCSVNAYCDAPPGYCGSTCNGGEPCIIANGWYQTTCDRLIQYEPCTPNEIDLVPYGFECPKTTYVGDCDENTTDYQCIDSVVSQCCTPGETNACGDGSCSGTESCSTCESDCGACVSEWCGDTTCNNGETCSTCATDCGACAGVCGDGSCNGGETCDSCQADCGECNLPTCGNGSCDSLEWCGNCSTDCGACVTCGDGVCNGGETCSSCSTDCGACVSCGDGVCNGSENCNSCATDCGSCSSNFCGDETCDIDESCATCEADCNACAENEAWFQISAGHIGSSNDGESSVAIQSKITDDSACVAPDCVRSLLSEDQSSTTNSDGFAVAGSGTIEANGLLNERGENISSSNTTKTRYNERYQFFYRNSGLGLDPSNDFIGSESDIQKPAYNENKVAYFQSGDVTIQSPWSVASGETYVIFIDGNLTLTDGDGASDQLIDVENGGFLAFIVSGDITIDSTLGNATLTDTTPNVEGVFIADGEFTIESRGEAAGGDDRIIAEGSYIGWSGVNLNRDFSDGAGRSVENNDKPIELFVYRPDFVVNMPDIMLVPIRIWQETN